MKSLLKMTAAAVVLASGALSAVPAHAARFGLSIGIGGGIGFSYESGGYCDRWGCPDDFWDYPIYYCPVFYHGYWYRGPVYYRYRHGAPYFWVRGGWHRDEWYDYDRPEWACVGRFGPPLDYDYYESHGFRWSDDWRYRWWEENRGFYPDYDFNWWRYHHRDWDRDHDFGRWHEHGHDHDNWYQRHGFDQDWKSHVKENRGWEHGNPGTTPGPGGDHNGEHQHDHEQGGPHNWNGDHGASGERHDHQNGSATNGDNGAGNDHGGSGDHRGHWYQPDNGPSVGGPNNPAPEGHDWRRHHDRGGDWQNGRDNGSPHANETGGPTGHSDMNGPGGSAFMPPSPPPHGDEGSHHERHGDGGGPHQDAMPFSGPSHSDESPHHDHHGDGGGPRQDAMPSSGPSHGDEGSHHDHGDGGGPHQDATPSSGPSRGDAGGGPSGAGDHGDHGDNGDHHHGHEGGP
jgi:hypothetical protein